MLKLQYDRCIVFAIGLGLFMPATSWLANPSNLTAILLFFCLILFRKRKALKDLFFGIFLISSLAIISSIVGFIVANKMYDLNPKPFMVFLRIQICYLALRHTVNSQSIKFSLLWIGLAAMIFAIAQFYIPSISIFTQKYYLAEERAALFENTNYENTILRATSFYESPSSVALVSIALSIFALHLYSTEKFAVIRVLPIWFICMMAGIFSFSKILIFAPFVLLQLFFLGYRWATFISLLTIFIAGKIFLTKDFLLVDLLKYTVNSAISPSSALDGRYLDTQLDIILNSPIFGYGIISTSDVVINDSVFLVLFYLIGGFGFCVLSTLLGIWIFRRMTCLPFSFFLIVGLFIFAGLGSNSILGYRVDIFLTALCSMIYFCNKSSLKKPLC
jgi:hypothetical protein